MSVLRTDLNQLVQSVAAPHIESFNYAMGRGLGTAVAWLDEAEVDIGANHVCRVKLLDVRVGRPSQRYARDALQYPSDAREGHTTYSAAAHGTLEVRMEPGVTVRTEVQLGWWPVMVRSEACNLHGMDGRELVEHKEEASEFGGYFVVRGLEKVSRILIAARRNHVMVLHRPAWAKKGPSYSAFGAAIKCVRADEYAETVTLHYLTTGGVKLRLKIRKQEFFVPLMLVIKALVAVTDREVYEAVVRGDACNTGISDRVEVLLRDRSYSATPLQTCAQHQALLGRIFRVALRRPARHSDAEVGRDLLSHFVLVHLESGRDKFDLLMYMLRRLYVTVAAGPDAADSSDSQAHQELLLSGHLYLALARERMQQWVNTVAFNLRRELADEPDRLADAVGDADALDREVKKAIDRSFDVGQKLEYLLTTGNLVSDSGLDMMQTTGLVIVADKLNYLRFLSHFRCVHRGQFFTTTKTTAVRKLIADSWGFLCPVHTPDGAPCGLLNHLSATCVVVCRDASPEDLEDLRRRLCSLGMRATAASDPPPHSHVDVVLNGRVEGSVPPDLAAAVALQLRRDKVLGDVPGVAETLEVAYVPPAETNAYPGLFLYTTRARMMRPVMPLHTPPRQGRSPYELIGTLEQLHIDVALERADLDRSPDCLHMEESPMSVLSVVASLTPFSDLNQSPRNMYQCVTVEHDVLTPRGWISIANVREGDLVMTIDIANDRQQWNDVQNVVKLEHDSPLYVFQGKGEHDVEEDISGVVTFSHRWLIREGDDWVYRTTEELMMKGSDVMILPVAGKNMNEGVGELTYEENMGVGELTYEENMGVGELTYEAVLRMSARQAREVLERMSGRLAREDARAGNSSIEVQVRSAEEERLVQTVGFMAEARVRVVGSGVLRVEFGQVQRRVGRPKEVGSGAVRHDGRVYCISVANGNFLTRRGGSVYFTGNCQMAKQTMATPCHSLAYRCDNKLYRLHTPQRPLVANEAQGRYDIDDYPMGTNAVVAVIAYTGYDMEDAMIINRSAYQRGFCHGSVYKTDILELNSAAAQQKRSQKFFENPQRVDDDGVQRRRYGEVDADGLPRVGTRLSEGDAYYSTVDRVTGESTLHRYRKSEAAYVDQVRAFGGDGDKATGLQKVLVKQRVPRNPIIGDKFSSRHGQKGVLSQLWPQADMPFSESGMSPDIIINPHAFPSRMTIGMLVESMAGKAAAMHGLDHDSTPFRFGEENTAVDCFARQLAAAGYQYYGNEPMYSGTTGGEMQADIFVGVVYYQRLRHMVSDKFQVRSTGPVNKLTRQPIKGRAKGGGIRFGEMERDSLISHGTSFLLQDRLFCNSDAHQSFLCSLCGTLLAISASSTRNIFCRLCNSNQLESIQLPFVLRYMANELAAMNIRLTFKTSE